MIRCGIPFDVAHALYPEEALAYAVAFGEQDGGEWSWDSLSWKDRD